MIRLVIVVSICGLFCSKTGLVLAQSEDSPERQIIKYSDGSIFIGSVVGSNQDRVVFLMSTGDTLNLEIDRIKKLRTVRDDVVIKQRGKYYYKEGIFASFDMGSSVTDEESGQFNLLAGYRLNARTSLGIGTGFHLNTLDTRAILVENDFAPVYAYGRRYIGGGNNNYGPFIATKVGYGFALSTLADHSGGFYAEPGIGLHFASRGKYRVTLSLSEYVQYTEGIQRRVDFVFNNPVLIDYTVWYTRLMFRVGVEFR